MKATVNTFTHWFGNIVGFFFLWRNDKYTHITVFYDTIVAIIIIIIILFVIIWSPKRWFSSQENLLLWWKEDPGLVLSTHIEYFTTIYDFKSRESN